MFPFFRESCHSDRQKRSAPSILSRRPSSFSVDRLVVYRHNNNNEVGRYLQTTVQRSDAGYRSLQSRGVDGH